MVLKENDLLEAMVPHFNLAIKRLCTPAWKIPSAVFPIYNILLVFDGEMTFGCNGSEFKAQKGDLVCFKPGDVRWANTNPDNLMKCYTIEFQYVCPIYENGNWSNVDFPLEFPTLSRIQDHYLFRHLIELFEEFIKHWTSGRSNRIYRCRAAFMEIISSLYKYFKSSNINYSAIYKVEKVIDYISKNYTRQLTLKELADSVKISPSYLGQIFKEATDITPFEFIIRYRIAQAKDLLEVGYSVTETARRVGFSDVFYFSKCFKRIEGIPPNKYLL